jgi:hypothetical protein
VARWVGVRSVRLGPVPFINHHRVGTEADRRGRGGMCFFTAGQCQVSRFRFGQGMFTETTPVQARFPIDAGGVGWIAVRLIGASSFWSVLASSGHGITRLDASSNQARAGTGPDQRRRLGMSNGMSRCRSALVGHGWQSSVRAGFVALVLGTAIAVGAVRLRRLVAG